jgi:hypothetical protein
MYLPIDFNPVLVEDKPHIRGRFSARNHKDTSEWYSYLYLGEHRVDERTTLLECIDTLSLGRSVDGTDRVLDLPSVSHLSFVYVRLRRSITLIDLTNEPNADIFGAQLSVLQGTNHRLTRRWARYLRSVAPQVDGLCYTPKKWGSAEDGTNLVLFCPHGMNGDMLDDEFSEVPLNSGPGIARLIHLSHYTHLQPLL